MCGKYFIVYFIPTIYILFYLFSSVSVLGDTIDDICLLGVLTYSLAVNLGLHSTLIVKKLSNHGTLLHKCIRHNCEICSEYLPTSSLPK